MTAQASDLRAERRGGRVPAFAAHGKRSVLLDQVDPSERRFVLLLDGAHDASGSHEHDSLGISMLWRIQLMKRRCLGETKTFFSCLLGERRTVSQKATLMYVKKTISVTLYEDRRRREMGGVMFGM